MSSSSIAHRVEAVVGPDGKLSLDDLPFKAGEVVEIIVRACAPIPAGWDSRAGRGTSAAYKEAFAGAIGFIEKYGSLAAGWDSYGAEPISEQAVLAAHRLLRALFDKLGASPGVRLDPEATMPLADGGLQFEWRGNVRGLEVEVGPSGTYGYVSSLGTGEHRELDEAHDVDLNALVRLVAEVLAAA
jgi:hypothetical protein